MHNFQRIIRIIDRFGLYLFFFLVVYGFVIFGTFALLRDVLSCHVPAWLSMLVSWSARPYMVLGFVFLACLVFVLVTDPWSKSKPNTPPADCPFPWYVASTTIEQRQAFERELHRLCGECVAGRKGTTRPLVEWLLAQQSDGLINLPDNYSQIYQLLSEHYGYGLSKQAFSAAMPTKS